MEIKIYITIDAPDTFDELKVTKEVFETEILTLINDLECTLINLEIK